MPHTETKFLKHNVCIFIPRDTFSVGYEGDCLSSGYNILYMESKNAE